MKPIQLFICAILMAVPILYVAMPALSSKPDYEAVMAEHDGSVFSIPEIASPHNASVSWPPVEGDRYPDLELLDQNGDTVRLSDFEGKTILLELSAVPCPGSQAFAGGNERGGFAGIDVQKGLDSIHHHVRNYAKIDLADHDDIVLVHLLLYGKAMGSPTRAEVTGWAQHFGMSRDQNEVVLGGEPFLLGKASMKMIPGFHLIDREFVLQYDSTGNDPDKDLFRDLLPALGNMARHAMFQREMGELAEKYRDND